MKFGESVRQIGRLTGVDVSLPDRESVCRWTQDGHRYKAFQSNHKWYWECSWGEEIQDSFECRNLLAQILQFNLKRMRFLDATLFLNPSDKRLYLRRTIVPEEISEKNLEEQFHDFLLNIEVMEEQFFPKLSKQRSV